MKATIIQSITELPVGDIDMNNRLRPVSSAGVEAIKASITELGVMKDAIHVRKIKRSGKIELLAGAHRLTAAGDLGWETIKVVCWDCNDDFARLMEIDDNLAGAELTALDTAVFLAERKKVYERLHPEATRGGARGNQHTGGWQTDTMSFCQATAEKFGISDRHVRRMVSAGSVLTGGDAHRLRSSERPITLNDLTEIAKIGDVSERYRVIDLLAEGAAKSAKDARKTWASEQNKGVTPPMNNTEKTWQRLQDAWKRAPKAGRVTFLEEHGDEVQALLDEIRGGRG
ncbi:ParB/RepB/Spo0J family partition protein [Tritonibacter scottomollicae]|uniref:ParB family chromosome partitioning protein n=1 Tax=Tritonibacter scottomollicae TaxID=483013 RepID=A0A2T1AIF1_TRISK|nr:ParB N-terminal domain-containing protein [Tritonibacter scottomollicae]PRZ48322.1 ParB family chromosome partitioning protein [Tritonibacter scottomollicae]